MKCPYSRALVKKKKPLPHHEAAAFENNLRTLTCGLSGRISEKPGGGGLQARPEQARKE